MDALPLSSWRPVCSSVKPRSFHAASSKKSPCSSKRRRGRSLESRRREDDRDQFRPFLAGGHKDHQLDVGDISEKRTMELSLGSPGERISEVDSAIPADWSTRSCWSERSIGSSKPTCRLELDGAESLIVGTAISFIRVIRCACGLAIPKHCIRVPVYTRFYSLLPCGKQPQRSRSEKGISYQWEDRLEV